MCLINCLVHSEGTGSPRGLTAARSTKGQQVCIITKTSSDQHLESLHSCRKRLAEHSWKTSLKHSYITPHSQSQAQTETISDQPLLHPQPAKHRGGCAGGAGGYINFLPDLLLYCAFVHIATIHHRLLTLPKMTLCL